MTEENPASTMTPTWNKRNGDARVAVIGCGPGGMFVCHAVELERQKLTHQKKNATMEEERNAIQSQIDRLPSVLCFEQADAPGGVWRTAKPQTTGSSFKTDTSMYEALWCNGPKEIMEFPDYTFETHFGKGSKLPVYLPRKAVLNYILSRVTRNCPNFFEKYAQFQTRVNNVTYDATRSLFTVQTTHLPTQTTTTAVFDKVIWSAGQNGAGKIPDPILRPFEEAQKSFMEKQSAMGIPNPSIPPFLHASSMEQSIATQIKNRHLLLIGGSYSAEDLAFMGIKWGARHITILARRHGIDVPVCWTANWPDNKVKVVTGYVVKRVEISETNDGRDPTYSLSLKKYANETDYVEVGLSEVEDKETVTITTPSSPTISAALSLDSPDSPKTVLVTEMIKSIDNVDVVICCTGYKEHLEMLDRSCYNMTDKEYKTYWNAGDLFDLPKDWKMGENPLTGILEAYYENEGGNDGVRDSDSEGNEVGEEAFEDARSHATETSASGTSAPSPPNQGIPPKRDSLYPGCYVNPYSYREFVFVHNPNLMWLAANNFDAPLLALDVQAFYAVKFLSGEILMPTMEHMKNENYQQALMEMTMPMVRYWMDTNYNNAVQRWLSETTEKVNYEDPKGNLCSEFNYPIEWQAAYKQTSRYELHLLARLMEESCYPLQLGSLHKLNENGERFMRINWNCRNYNTCPIARTTFRDVDESDCSRIKSMFTGARPAPLNRKWLDIDDFMENVSDMVV